MQALANTTLRVLVIAALVLLAAGVAQAQPAGVSPDVPPRAEKRVALVIGVAAYQRAGRLSATLNDARAMGQALTARGFTLAAGGPVLDPTKPQMERAVRDFAVAAADADVAVFYFSGHGTQAVGRNWMIPVEAGGGGSEAAAPLTMLDVEVVVQQLAAARVDLGILIFDACRNNTYNPTATVRDWRAGLAPMRAPPGMLMAFATEPGNVTDDGPADGNSPYTRALLRAMQMPGADLLRVFNAAAVETRRESVDSRRQSGLAPQTPWLALSPLERDFIFTPVTGIPAAGGPPPVVVIPPVATAPPVAAPAAVASGDPSFNLINLSGSRVSSLRASLSSNSQWGANRLGESVMTPGSRFALGFDGAQACAVDLQVTFEGRPQPVEQRRLDTCPFHTMMLLPDGRVVPANADFELVNDTGRPLRDVRVSFSNDSDWGGNRLTGGAVLPPGGRLPIGLPRGIECLVDVRGVPAQGDPVEMRRQQLCTADRLALR